MKRRKFLQLFAGVSLAWPSLAVGQRGAPLPLVAVLIPFTEDLATERSAALRTGLKQAGLVEGADFALALRFANGDWSRLPELAKELAALKPSVFVVAASLTSLVAARRSQTGRPCRRYRLYACAALR